MPPSPLTLCLPSVFLKKVSFRGVSKDLAFYIISLLLLPVSHLSISHFLHAFPRLTLDSLVDA